ncbi:5-dehydro-4-deoxyglucarate dehydratase [Streptomyces sp. CMB-StM0423]|uniref:5-dehydro-4-deoxyglucarate dehydratase n=1 Tax=Streptomyces sp. CMB-StM0423 TaxID=2059884 RepID=UPI000C70148E|nr:5-dehydro-4-deoxyglucarate dehydratase [Streptomyces sp. CMB-StM0423]AUH40636.1 5-dehydro-4-deoxyglucarate dehydratase [Streptomyces sp. CMB-StM0423]
MQLDGILFFPLTPFDAAGAVHEDVLARHVADGVAHGAGAVFAACGTGEFHALDGAEHRRVVRTAVAAAAGRVPVFAGAGGPLPHAVACARAAEEAGADGLLLMPPYLVAAPEAGLVAYVREVAAATGLPLVVYQRDNARFTPAGAAELARIPTVTGFKDGLGDIELMQRVVPAVHAALAGGEGPAKDFTFFNGLPTAEVSAAAYAAVGARLYSSAVFCFVPEVALAFHRARAAGDDARVRRLLSGFFIPLVHLRNEVPGYAVALVKAGARMRGLDAGGVRPPLVDPHPKHLAELELIVAAGLDMAGAGR